MKIDLLLPTRGRVQRLRQLFSSIVLTASILENISMWLYVDDDDKETLDQWDDLVAQFPKLSINKVVGPRITISKAWNHCWEASSGDILMLCADDIVFQTSAWDITVMNAFSMTRDNIALVWGFDCVVPHQRWFGVVPFVSRKSTEVLGYFCPPYFKCDYNDSWLDEIYGAIGRKIYYPNMVIQHMHHTVHPELADDTEREMRTHMEEAKKLWEGTKKERVLDAKKLFNYIIGK